MLHNTPIIVRVLGFILLIFVVLFILFIFNLVKNNGFSVDYGILVVLTLYFFSILVISIVGYKILQFSNYDNYFKLLLVSILLAVFTFLVEKHSLTIHYFLCGGEARQLLKGCELLLQKPLTSYKDYLFN